MGDQNDWKLLDSYKHPPDILEPGVWEVEFTSGSQVGIVGWNKTAISALSLESAKKGELKYRIRRKEPKAQTDGETPAKSQDASILMVVRKAIDEHQILPITIVATINEAAKLADYGVYADEVLAIKRSDIDKKNLDAMCSATERQSYEDMADEYIKYGDGVIVYGNVLLHADEIESIQKRAFIAGCRAMDESEESE